MVNLNYKEIEIVNDNRGIPCASIRKKGIANFKIHVSLSHSREDALAFAIAMPGAETQH